MAGNEWEKFGDEIRKTVQDAIENQDFHRLNQNITDTIDRAMGTAFHNVSERMKQARGRTEEYIGSQWIGYGEDRGTFRNSRYEGTPGGYPHGGPGGMNAQTMPNRGSQYGGVGGYPHSRPGGMNAQTMPNRRTQYGGVAGDYPYGGPGGMNAQAGSNPGSRYDVPNQGSQYGGTAGEYRYGRQNNGNAETAPRPGRPAVYRRDASDQEIPALFYKKPRGVKAQGILLSIAGGWFGIPFACTSIYSMIISFAGGFHPEYLPAATLCMFSAFGSLWAMKSGINLCGLQSRFLKLVRGIGSREYCDVKELSLMIGRTEAKTVKDLQKMSRKGWFKQPHFDESKKCFMVSDRMYQEYMRLESQRKEETETLEEKTMEDERSAKERDAKLTPEVRQVIEAGDAFIQKIHACNDAILGEKISAKISRMELLVDGIFDRVERNPETVSDVRRLMDYYLPTTVKLLEAYRDLDAQPVAGENIKTSKQEIEATLDTLNQAFEKILDDLFHRTAWDVSSDISVLNTMLAREGLTDEGIKLS